jgi:hypothetical protein
MHQVQLSEQVYKEAERRALDAGYPSVDDYVAEVVSQGFLDDADVDLLFTPERLAHIDRATAEIENGDFFTPKQAEAELAKRRSQWLQNHAR